MVLCWKIQKSDCVLKKTTDDEVSGQYWVGKVSNDIL